MVANIKLDAATNYSVPPIKLEVGAAKESITVEAGAEVVNTTDTEVSSTVEKRQIEALPILDRNPLNLLSLEAGVNSSGPSNGSGPTDTVIDGQRSTFSNLTLDGINIQDNFIRENALDFSPNQPFSSQAQEFTVINQNGAWRMAGDRPKSASSPRRERTTGTAKASGTTARTRGRPTIGSTTLAELRTPNLLRNQGGGNLGGPILKDKLFIYGWYELLRLRQQAVNNTTVISPTIFNALTSANPTLADFTFTSGTTRNGNPDPAGPTDDKFAELHSNNKRDQFQLHGRSDNAGVDPTRSPRRSPTTRAWAMA